MTDISHGCINQFCDECGGSESCQIFKARQVDLSDDNKADIIDALINNTWGTINVISDNNTINLDIYLRELGINPEDLPEFISSDIFNPITFDLTRELSMLVPEGSGIDLSQIAEIEKRQFVFNITSGSGDPILTSRSIALQQLIDDLKGGLADTIGAGTLETRVRDLDPEMVYSGVNCSSHNCADETTLDTQISSDVGVVGIIGLIALVVLS